ncbi:fibronectin type III domain-containing protein [Microcella humidisoli]|uniref:Fibronectin type III domain-containing protein n=1 Tax=Microcella humidisoli TaxID=2963406 RepID=A0ABY5FXG3_9MICO|nr:fibronectin type III domain-containing protein [Microcella humidisoli]UTT62995.1 fibronectin type III domain-containing protein [Microcella humidisoli]
MQYSRFMGLTAGLTTIVVLGSLIAPGPATAQSTALPSTDGETSAYLVEVTENAAGRAAEQAVIAEGALVEQYEQVIEGFTAELTEEQAAALDALPGVVDVVEHVAIRPGTTQPSAPWGLSRLDSDSATSDGQYTYPDSAGSGVRIYVVDTGVSPNSTQFGSRLVSGRNFATDRGAVPNSSTADCGSGHGTHVAGTAASASYGVAKAATIVPVRVFTCSGTGSTIELLAALDWIMTQPAGVVNLSLVTSSVFAPLDDRIQTVVDDGHLVVVAAGNDAKDACTVSPAGAPNAITVGATTSQDARSSFSNFGTCVDLFAPGSSITSVDWNSSSPMTMSGTSMASPHVAGIGALVMSQNPGLTPAQVTSMIVAGAQTGVVTSAGTGSPNRLARVSFLPLRPGSLTGISSSIDEQARVSVAWQAPAAQTGLVVTDYAIEYKPASSSTWSRVNDGTSTTTSYTFSSLAEATTYDVRVAAVSGTGLGAWSTVQATAPRLSPTAVSTLTVVDTTWNSLSLSWSAPETAGASGVVDYELGFSSDGGSTWRTVADGTSSATTGLVTGLASNREYRLRVRAVNDDYSGAWTTVIGRTRTMSPAAVTSLTVTETTATSMSLSWTAPPWEGSTPVTDYRIQYSGDNGKTWYTFSDGKSPATTAIVSGRVPNRSYLLRVAAVNSAYTGATATVSTRTRTASPAAVTGLTVTGVTTSSMSISWTAPSWSGSSAIRDYRIQYSGDNGKTWKTFTDGISTGTSATVSGRLSNRTYLLRVAAVNSAYTGAYTKVTAKTLSAAPGAVTGLTVTGTTSTTMSLSWTAPAWQGSTPVKDYRVQYSGDNGKTWYTFSDGISTDTIATVSGRIPDRAYLLRVAAVNNGYTGTSVTVATRTLPAV